MTPIIVTSKVGPDGVLHLALPVGREEANKEVQVTVLPIARPVMTPEEWRAWVLSMAGTWEGDFERPPQGEFEDREPLS